MKKHEIKPVRVDWVDSTGQPGWGEYEKDTDLMCVSVGHLIMSDTESVVLALNKSAYGFGDYITIPRIAVKRVRKLK